MRKVIGIGETILDIIFKEDKPQAAVPGGSVFNALTSLGRMNIPVSIISEVGNDKVGDIIEQFMHENNISTESIDKYPQGKTPISLAFLDEKSDAHYIFYKDYINQRIETELPKIEKDDIFVFGSYYALNPVLRPKMLECLNYAKQQGALIYYDPNFRESHAHEAFKLKPIVLENLEFADIVRGSDEDFFNLFNKKCMQEVYKEHINYYVDYFVSTHAAQGVHLYTPNYDQHYSVSKIQTKSTIGAGDNFNAGFIYGLLKYNITKEMLPHLDSAVWQDIIKCGIDLSLEVCQSYENFISLDFARNYLKQS